uniref:Uncharacterized protein n=1 Tax=Salix viminalis TaxID=40686 RepID=A0A6N2M4M5_SALVM
MAKSGSHPKATELNRKNPSPGLARKQPCFRYSRSHRCSLLGFWLLKRLEMDTSSRISKIRSNERERLHGPPWLKALQRALLSCTYTMLDYAQTGLIAAVFFFKMMEWWYQSAEERVSAPTVYPPPPPPPAPKLHVHIAPQNNMFFLSSFSHLHLEWPAIIFY